jgi:hypothetical protein
MTQASWGSISLDSAMASQTKKGNTRKFSMWAAGLALHLHGYREFIVSRHHTLSAASGLSLFCPRSLLSCVDSLDTYIFFSLSLPHCVCLLSNLSLEQLPSSSLDIPDFVIFLQPLSTHGVLTPPAAIRIPTSAKQPIYKHDISQPQVLHYFRPRNGQVGGNNRRTQPERFHH